MLRNSSHTRSAMVDEAWRPWVGTLVASRTSIWWRGLAQGLLVVGPIVWALTVAGLPGLSLPTVLLIAFASLITASALWRVMNGTAWRLDLAAKNGLDARTGEPLRQVQVVEFTPRCRNVAITPMAAAVLVVTGPVAMVAGEVGNSGPPMNGRWELMALAYLACIVLGPAQLLAARARTSRRIPHHVASPTTLTSACIVAIAAVAGLVAAPMSAAVGPMGHAAVGATISLSGGALLIVARRIGVRRGAPIGIWDLAPSLGPVAAMAPTEAATPT